MTRAPRLGHSNRRTVGISVIEVIVVISIIGVLAGLILPAVQHSREAARNISCINHLHQFALAFANYESIFQVFPSGGVPLERVGRHLDWRGNFDLDKSVARCPSDGRQLQAFNYLVNDGSGFRSDKRNGFVSGWGLGEDIGPADVSDGLSHTAAMSERLVTAGTDAALPESELAREPLRFLWYTDPGSNDLPIFQDQCDHNRVSQYPNEVNPSDASGFSGYDHIAPPNHPGCYNVEFPPPNEFYMYMKSAITATSNHPGHVNVMMGDGSVRMVHDHIARLVWFALGTRDGAETADSGW